MNVEPVVLDGAHVRLEPLGEQHSPDLLVAAQPGVFRWMPFSLETEKGMRGFLKATLKMAEAKTALPFAIILKATGRAIGGTGYWNIDAHHRRLEIGASWITPQWQRSAVNTEAKYLLLQHAFEQLGCIRVEFKTDSLNERSRTALKRIGAHEEGVLRNHMIMPDGRRRHSGCFSILDDEWPEIKNRLEERLSAQVPAPG